MCVCERRWKVRVSCNIFRGLTDLLPEYLEQQNEEIEALQVSSFLLLELITPSY